jgi:hypothetical protein
MVKRFSYRHHRFGIRKEKDFGQLEAETKYHDVILLFIFVDRGKLCDVE